jgi:hypothetical protein
MMPKGTEATVAPSEAAQIDRQISDVARRISTGEKVANDASQMNDLIRRRANLLVPKSIGDRRQAK